MQTICVSIGDSSNTGKGDTGGLAGSARESEFSNNIFYGHVYNEGGSSSEHSRPSTSPKQKKII